MVKRLKDFKIEDRKARPTMAGQSYLCNSAMMKQPSALLCTVLNV